MIGEMLLNLLNVYHNAEVHVKEGAQILSRGDVDLTATVEEGGSILSLLPDSVMNMLNVKVGEATVTVDGTVKAGYEEDGKQAWTDGYGSVRLEADVRTICGYKYEPVQSEAFQATSGYKVPFLSVAAFPVALNVVVSDSNVRVNQNAQVSAAGDIVLRAENETRAMANAVSGFIQIPLSIAVNVVSSDAQALAKGTLTAGGNVLIASRGAQYITAKSAHGSSQTVLNSSLYGALNVVVQNVTARTGGDKDERYTGTTKITAGGHVRVKSDTIADVRDNVTSGVSPNAPRSSFTPPSTASAT